jgi:hypothetical protein
MLHLSAIHFALHFHQSSSPLERMRAYVDPLQQRPPPQGQVNAGVYNNLVGALVATIVDTVLCLISLAV